MIRNFLRWLAYGCKPWRALASFDPVAGELVSVADEDGQFAVMKLLAADPHGVHVRLYVQRFASRPTKRELAKVELKTAPFGPDHDNRFSIGHLPLSYASFAAWQPNLICQSEVAEEELEGYRIGDEAKGGYF